MFYSAMNVVHIQTFGVDRLGKTHEQGSWPQGRVSPFERSRRASGASLRSRMRRRRRIFGMRFLIGEMLLVVRGDKGRGSTTRPCLFGERLLIDERRPPGCTSSGVPTDDLDLLRAAVAVMSIASLASWSAERTTRRARLSP